MINSNFEVCLHPDIITPTREQDGADKLSLQFWKTGYLDVTKTIEN